MKKLLSILIILLLIPIALAQEESTIADEEDTGVLPDSPFYGFKLAFERLNLALTFNRAAKAEKRLLQAQRRLQEIEIMLAKNKIKAAEKAQLQYDKLLEKIEELEITNPEKAAKIQERLDKHQEKLEQIRERAEKRVELNQEQKEKIQEMLNKIENKTEKTRQQAITSIEKNIEKLEAANKTNQIQAIQALTRVKEKLQERVQEREQLVGGNCGTLSPDSRDECCKGGGYNNWDEEKDRCVFGLREQIEEQTQAKNQETI